ncbi:Protein of unknown function (DUF1638) [Desulfosporosinus orientis DSM 765]|uniref:DUF1638 domain-containing protein n=1 Tax=Desulfosporosinus orientis (strain ATCC 19365 / DSM 765 / NCIMB 8382 / VKM B-1628 / Singapore I) TaxID=768706 RepID=G7WHR1_DESOD|nr:DUF1638 domain-containing protein [Desulfosporosinus orientis]AET69623.1 Protein of unknown function (DUF1638) [Desulfosporosinus orientis DSM 765]
MSLKIIACEVMKEELLSAAAGADIEFEFLPQGRHNYPEKLGQELQTILDGLTGYSQVVLAFGLCGNATKNLRAGDFKLTIPRVHDCIPLLLGSRESYKKVHKEEVGTLYMSCGWTNSDGSVIAEYNRSVEKYGAKKTARIYEMMYSGYKRVLFIQTGVPTEEKHLQVSRGIGELLKLDHQITQGSLIYIDRLVNGPWPDQDFINIPPHGVINESDFLVPI